MIQVQYHHGVYLPHQDLWLDPREAKRLAFVSHAHADHIAPHQEIIVSERTARLMQARMPGERCEHVVPFDTPTQIRDLHLRLLPAGHIFGSAQFFLESDAGSLLYTGDFKLRPGRSAEPTQWCQADTLIMETTFGLPKYKFPPTEEVVAQILAFCRDALEEKATPVLLGYSLGKAQEILCSLAGAGLQPMLHGSVYRMTRIYEKFGQSCGEYERYDERALEGKVLICPPSANRSRMLEKIPHKRVAMISGWAIDPNARFRYQTDAAFTLSDHADYTDLIRYVELVQPKRVLTLHGFAAEFARDLRERGIEAWALSQENQLELSLRQAAPVVSVPAPLRPRQRPLPSLATLRPWANPLPPRLGSWKKCDCSQLTSALSIPPNSRLPPVTSPEKLSHKVIRARFRWDGRWSSALFSPPRNWATRSCTASRAATAILARAPSRRWTVALLLSPFRSLHPRNFLGNSSKPAVRSRKQSSCKTDSPD